MIHSALLNLVAAAEAATGMTLAVNADGETTLTQIGTAGPFVHRVTVSGDASIVAPAMQKAAHDAEIAAWICWGGAPTKWIADADPDAPEAGDVQLYQLGSLIGDAT